MNNVTPIRPTGQVRRFSDEDMGGVVDRLDTVQSYIVVCQLALQQQGCDMDFRVAELLGKASTLLCVATEALRGDEEATETLREGSP